MVFVVVFVLSFFFITSFLTSGFISSLAVALGTSFDCVPNVVPNTDLALQVGFLPLVFLRGLSICRRATESILVFVHLEWASVFLLLLPHGSGVG